MLSTPPLALVTCLTTDQTRRGEHATTTRRVTLGWLACRYQMSTTALPKTA